MNKLLEEVIKVQNVSKVYKLYNKPIDRLKESINPFRIKYHNDFYALHDLSFSINKGETVGILGKNGAGKSTILKMITGVLAPTSGEIVVNGKVSALLELGAGFNPELTGIENIYLNGTIMGFSREEMDGKLENILTFAEIGDFVYQPVKMYSSGMFARLAFALAINVEPDILIVDEALSVGDVRFQSKCLNKFRSLKKQGITILFVSHDIQSIRNFCDKVIWIDNGAIRRIGDTVEITAEYTEFMNTIQQEEMKLSKVMNFEIQGSYTKDESNVPKSEFNPINRWGSHEGLIRYVDIINSKDNETDIVEVGEQIEIKVIFSLPADIDLDTLSAAISIKNKLGMDLVVSTTYDNNYLRIHQHKGFVEVTFKFYNFLNPGEYILVAALENRIQSIPEYYDYIEGAKYFRVFSKKQLFGLITLPTTHEIKYLGDE